MYIDISYYNFRKKLLRLQEIIDFFLTKFYVGCFFVFFMVIMKKGEI